jgi:glycosyltransferase involved in cell wall biosynthesis
MVEANACRSCCAFPEPSAGRLNPVVASLLYDLSGRVLEAGGRPGCRLARARAVRDAAESALAADGPAVAEYIRLVSAREEIPGEARVPHEVDVVVCCSGPAQQLDRAIRSVLDQRDVSVFLHLVDDGGRARELLASYVGRRNVFVYRKAAHEGLFRALQDCVPSLRSEFVAVQDAATISLPRRLADAVELLVAYGADLLAAALQTPEKTEYPAPPGPSYDRTLPPETLVMRRSAVVDMGGVADRADDAGVELVFRACRERRQIVLCARVMVASDTPMHRREAPAPPVYAPRDGILRHHALGFPTESVACDVVLPFHGQVGYVHEAIASLLEQEGADVVVHLIDDASPGGESEALLRRWAAHRRVRTYRNRENIGPYSSFNNVVSYLETELVAVQDGDDISLPHRIHTAGNLLRLAGGEIFGGRTRPFGAEAALRPSPANAFEVIQVARPRYRGSRVPTPRSLGHIVEHPTAMYRIAAFQRLGGFADFGQTDRNCCGLDTEFYLRAAHGGARFAVSNQVVLRYRCHAGSATQNFATGWGSAPRNWTLRECRRRALLYRSVPFDPGAFGALGRYTGVTRRYPQEW